MASEIQYGQYVRESTLKQRSVSYNNLIPKLEIDSQGQAVPYHPPKLKLQSADIYNLLAPYFNVRLIEQVKAVFPLAIYLILFQILILRQPVQEAVLITGGLGAVILGLMVFMEGLKLGLMPFGEVIGTNLPKKSPLPVVLLIAFLLGIGVTFAEPAIGALQAVGSIVNVEKAPYLRTLLGEWAGTLVLVVGMGVGLAAVLGTSRFLYNWSLKPMIYMALVPTIGLTVYCMQDPDLAKILGLAWDCGAVTTGPVTVPLVLALGIGIAASGGKGESSLSGFGIVTLASLFPIIAVLCLAVYVSTVTTPEAIIAAAQASTAVAAVPAWHELTPWAEIKGGAQAIIPLVIFLFLVLKLVLREKVQEAGILTYGLVLCVTGMMIFNVGLSYGLAKLGEQSGSMVPAAFKGIEAVAGSPLYTYALGIFIAGMFAWLLGFGATLAEPALNALGQTVETLTNGSFKKTTLMYAVSIGVGFGLTLGVMKIIFEWPIAYMVIVGYTIGIVLTALSSEEFVNVAWDSAGVTTGPITVPLVLAMGLGFGNAVEAVEGFGILSMASICPIVSVLITGLWVQRGSSAEKSAA
ncbi:uncharacterized protein METZ01_LOCUS150721 [marine metagenome]|uniref:DUF1538 domain-containing protein n=1 Tax=marine metagenome TaxID=408172 RepID=A0A382A9Z4_9ZZZZ